MNVHPRAFCRVLPFILAATALCARAQPAAKLLVRNATVVTLEDAQPDPFHGYLVVGGDGRIAQIGSGEPPSGLTAATTYDAGGKVVMPGFISGHSHLWQSAFRGIAADQWVSGWLLQVHRTYGQFFGPGDPYYFTLHGALDYVRHGITTTFNYSQNLGFTPALYEEQFQAELDAGGRFIFGYALSARPDLVTSRRNFETFYNRTKAMPPSPLLLKVSLAGEGFAPDYLKLVAALMREHGLDIQMHYLEGPGPGSVAQQASFADLQSTGILGPKLVFAHFIHTTDAILAATGAAGGGMIWNPLSNGRLASGLADIPKYRQAGVNIGMGLDGQASADLADPFENMRMGMYGLRMKYQRATVLMPLDVLKLHTIGTARVLGVADRVGTLREGKFADFLVVDPGNLDTGPVYDLYSTLVFACKISNLDRVYVGGDWVVERGRPLRHEMGRVTAEVDSRVANIRARCADARSKLTSFGSAPPAAAPPSR
jgi:cytosine/adenosine deaminase-related metal-dependent hydrolase